MVLSQLFVSFQLISFPQFLLFLQSLGLVARIAQCYLLQRQKQHYLQYPKQLQTGSNANAGASAGADPLTTGVLELIESPMQQVKRAGLGLLSKGLGR